LGPINGLLAGFEAIVFRSFFCWLFSAFSQSLLMHESLLSECLLISDNEKFFDLYIALLGLRPATG